MQLLNLPGNNNDILYGTRSNLKFRKTLKKYYVIKLIYNSLQHTTDSINSFITV